MIDLLDIRDNNYNVVEYRRDALMALSQIHDRRSAAIVVGGTNYYAESLIFGRLPSKSITLTEDCQSKELQASNLTNHAKMNKDCKDFPEQRFHPNDTRRNAERKMKNQTDPSNQLNLDYTQRLFQRILIIAIINKDGDFVRQLVDKRIEQMLFEADGFEEIFAVLDAFFLNIFLEENGSEAQMSDEVNRGIMQAIGYKEFIPLYNQVNQAVRQQTGNVKQTFVGFRGSIVKGFKKREYRQFADVIGDCMEQLGRHTVKLYKNQIKWLRRRILSNPSLKPFIRLHEFDREAYEADGLKKLFSRIIEEADDFASDRIELLDAGEIDEHIQSHSTKQIFECEMCLERFSNEFNFQQHLNSKAHRSKFKRVKIASESERLIDDTVKYYCKACERTIVGIQFFRNHSQSKQHRKKSKGGMIAIEDQI